MSSKTPRISEAALYAPELGNSCIELSSPAWLRWLEQETTGSFSYPLFEARRGYIIGFMTVRKERRRRGGQYWTVYRRQGRRLRKVYLGQSERVTGVRLAQVAERLLQEEEAARAAERPERHERW